MNSEPLISVVIPVCNGEKHIAAALHSVLDQDYPSLQILVVDDGSIDRSAEIVRAFPEARYFHQSNRGVAAARNAGLSQAKGELLAFLDQDDVWTEGKLRAQVDFLARNPELGFCLGRQRFVLENRDELPSWAREKHLADHDGYLLGTLLARRSVFTEIGGFDPDYRFASDSDWFFRAQEAGIRWRVLDRLVLRKRIHESNESHRVRELRTELFRVVQKSLSRRRRLAT